MTSLTPDWLTLWYICSSVPCGASVKADLSEQEARARECLVFTITLFCILFVRASLIGIFLPS